MKGQHSLIVAPQLQLQLSAQRVRFEEQLRRQVVEILARLLETALEANATKEVNDEDP